MGLQAETALSMPGCALRRDPLFQDKSRSLAYLGGVRAVRGVSGVSRTLAIPETCGTQGIEALDVDPTATVGVRLGKPAMQRRGFAAGRGS